MNTKLLGSTTGQVVLAKGSACVSINARFRYEEKLVKKLYFAHPINTYGTPLECELISLIESIWPDYEIINPGDQIHKDKVSELRAKDPTVNVMPYFEELVRFCSDIIVLPFGDGMWGSGIWREVEVFREGCHGEASAWFIDPKTKSFYFVPQNIQLLKLSVEETRSRIRNPDGTPKPYV